MRLSRGVNEKNNVFGTFGYLFSGTASDDGVYVDLDNGYYFAAGARYQVYQSGQMTGYFYGQLDYTLDEKYSGEWRNIDIDLEFSGYEMSIGGIVEFKMMENLDVYGGIGKRDTARPEQ